MHGAEPVTVFSRGPRPTGEEHRLREWDELGQGGLDEKGCSRDLVPGLSGFRICPLGSSGNKPGGRAVAQTW